MAHSVMRINQPSVNVFDSSHLDSRSKRTAPKLKEEEAKVSCDYCHEKHGLSEKCPPCHICHDGEYHRSYDCPEFPCDICNVKHRPAKCPYFTCIPKGATLNPHYEIVCRCGNQFDEERWACTVCGSTRAMILPKCCGICYSGGHSSYQCHSNKERAADYERLRDEKNRLGASIERKLYVSESSDYVPSSPRLSEFKAQGFN